MNLWIPRNCKELKQHLSDPLFKNAYFLMFSSVTSAGSGFFFWLFATRFYSTAEVGLASAIIAAMGLLGMISMLGFDISLVRFLPEQEDKAELINSCLTISFIFSFALTMIFIAGIELWSPSLIIIKENKLLLLLFVVFTVIVPLHGLQSSGVFVGFRKTEYSFFQTIAIFLRLAIVPCLVSFGALGIYASYGLTLILAFGLGIYLTSKIFSYKLIPTVKIDVVNDIFHFSFGNYFARIFEMLPTFILPIMVINILGAEMNAYFYIAWQISMLLLAVPRWTSTSLLAEGSYNRENLRRDTKKAAKFIFLLLGVAILGIFLFGKYLLWVFGEEYAKNSFEVLSILVLGSIPFAFNSLYATTKRVQKEIKPVIFVYGGIAMITIVGSYLLMQSMGIIGVGIAWVIGNGVVTAGIIVSGKSDTHIIKTFPKDLALVILFTLLCTPFVLIPPANETPIRIILGLALVLFLPGYSLIAVLFPRKDDLDAIERIIFSFGLSIASTPLLGLALNYTPFGIRLSPILIVLSIFTISLAMCAYVRRSMIPEKDRFGVEFGTAFKVVKESFKSSDTKIDRILSVILIISIILASSMTVYVIVTPKQGEKFTEFYILGPGGKASDYPTNLRVGEEREVIIGVVNHEYTNVMYQLEVKLDGEVIDERIVDLKHNETWEYPFAVRAKKTGENQKLEFLLYKEGDAYRSLHLWVDVT